MLMSALYSSCCIPRLRAPSTDLTGGYVGPRTYLQVVMTREVTVLAHIQSLYKGMTDVCNILSQIVHSELKTVKH